MNLYAKLIVSLAVTAGIASGLLALTYTTTKPVIEQREIEDQAKALENVFFLQKDAGSGAFTLTGRGLTDDVTALYAADDPDTPVYYAVTGEGTGYNSGVSISLMVGFTADGREAAPLLEGYVPENLLPASGARGEYIVGFSVISSEETPGLGEKIKDSRPPYTWAQALTGRKPAPSPDVSTDFQRQFRGRLAGSLRLKKDGGDLDAITASTITSNGIIAALRDASGKLESALAARP